MATSAEACSRPKASGKAAQVIDTKRIDQNTFDKAVLGEVSFHRCQNKVRKLSKGGTGLNKEAYRHSQWMAKTTQLGHKNTIKGRETLVQRVKGSGVKFKTAAENVGMVHRFGVDGKSFRIVDAKACKFETYEGQAIGEHSYASLAQLIVQLWMNSPGHRKNVLHKDMGYVSTAVAIEPAGEFCGRYWITQDFYG
ncbi:MAG: CAP domain-containing protein [Rhodobacteraceae bacterium]|nr:CAP domain-containing protein [Paracoccaceae bacterium]